MQAKSLRQLILQAIGASLATGCLAAAGCSSAREARAVDAGGEMSQDASAGESGADGGRAGAGRAGKGGVGGVGGVGGKRGTIPPNCTEYSAGLCCTHEACVARTPVMGDSEDGGTTLAACPQRPQNQGVCMILADATRETDTECCYREYTGSCCGRPFMVGGAARTARVDSSAEWIALSLPRDLALDESTRVELARAWLADASLEHASIASFARFTLQALSLGAPPDLIADAQRAALDEVAHAQLCFGLASRYAGSPVGPGAFGMAGALEPTTLAEAVAATVREGCVGETLSALVAQAQLARATDANVREVLSRIAEDEARHAELAWRFVGWGLRSGGDAVRAAVKDAFGEALARVYLEPSRDLPPVDLTTWHAHGRLMAVEERACWLEAARDVIEPCADRLLSV